MRNTERNPIQATPGRLPMQSHGSQGETHFPQNLFCVSPQTAQLIVTCCYHHRAGKRSDPDGCGLPFPIASRWDRQGVKLLQEALNRAPIVAS